MALVSDSCGKVFTVTGWSGSGKTTFCERLVAELSSRGMRVGVIKHHGHPTPTDADGSDSSRYAHAGARCVALSSPVECVVRRFPERERTLEELASEISGECDIVIAEGFKHQAIRPVELCRAAHNEEPVLGADSLFAMITDSPARAAEGSRAGVPVLALDDVAGMADIMCAELGWRE